MGLVVPEANLRTLVLKGGNRIYEGEKIKSSIDYEDKNYVFYGSRIKGSSTINIYTHNFLLLGISLITDKFEETYSSYMDIVVKDTNGKILLSKLEYHSGLIIPVNNHEQVQYFKPTDVLLDKSKMTIKFIIYGDELYHITIFIKRLANQNTGKPNDNDILRITMRNPDGKNIQYEIKDL